MKESEKVKDYFSRVIEVVNQMRTYGKDIHDQKIVENFRRKKIVEKFLMSLPEKYEYIVAAIESKDLATHDPATNELIGVPWRKEITTRGKFRELHRERISVKAEFQASKFKVSWEISEKRRIQDEICKESTPKIKEKKVCPT
jgi:hypothetical protein